MSAIIFIGCPRCEETMQNGFYIKNCGLFFVAPEKINKNFYIAENLPKISFLKKLFLWKAVYFDSYLCRSCELYIIDFSTTLSRAEAEQLTQSRSESS